MKAIMHRQACFQNKEEPICLGMAFVYAKFQKSLPKTDERREMDER